MTYDPSAQQPNDPYNPYPDSPPPQQPNNPYPDSPPAQPTSGGYYPQQPGYDQYSQPGYQQPGYQQPGYQQPGYQQPGYQAPGYQVPPTTPGYIPGQELPQGMAVTSMVLGIVSIPLLFCCGAGIISGIMAIIFGAIGTSQAKKGEARGQGMAMAGLILGAVTVVLFIVYIVLYLAVGFAGLYSPSDFDSSY